MIVGIHLSVYHRLPHPAIAQIAYFGILSPQVALQTAEELHFLFFLACQCCAEYNATCNVWTVWEEAHPSQLSRDRSTLPPMFLVGSTAVR